MTKRKQVHRPRHLSDLTLRSGDPQATRAEELLLRERIQGLEREKLALEEQVRRLHYVKSVSELLTAVSHDLSGALTGILWCTEALKKRVTDYDPDLGAGIDDLISAADYARKLARKLMSSSVHKQGRFERCSITHAVEEAAKLLDVLRPRSVKLVCALDAKGAEIWGCSEELQQVVINLGTNAFDAVVPAGGVVRLELTQTQNAVILRLTDTGHGMTPEVLRRATEPLFTTKGASGGNGLGLVVVKTILERHAAHFSLASTEGKGTTAEVSFPLLPRA